MTNYIKLFIVEIISLIVLLSIYSLYLYPFVLIIDVIDVSLIFYFTVVMFGVTTILSSIKVWKTYRGKSMDYEEAPYIYDMIDDMDCSTNGDDVNIIIIKSNVPNAYVVDALPMKPNIVITEGLLNTLSGDEIQSVIAHEISHIRSYDVFYTTILSSILSFLVELTNTIGMNMRSDRIINVIILVIPYIIIRTTLLIARGIFYYISRVREYSADRDASRYTSIDSMQSALASISTEMSNVNEEEKKMFQDYEALCIASLGDVKTNIIDKIFRTHPDINDRIEKLEKIR